MNDARVTEGETDPGRMARIVSLREQLEGIYGRERGAALLPVVCAIADRTRAAILAEERAQRPRAPGSARWSEHDVAIITYANTLRVVGEAPLGTLRRFLRDHLAGLVSTVHVLPFYPWSSDDGFAVIDYYGVDPSLGTWADVEALADDFAVMADLVINHVSRESLWFIDFVSDRDPGRNYFITAPLETDVSAVVRPRATPLLVPIHTYRGLRHVWATFSDDQIDLDFSNPDVMAEIVRVLCFLLQNGARVLRLDAVAYLWKELGTACIHHPNTHRVVRALRGISDLVCDPQTDPVVLITETNVPHEENISYFGSGDEAHMVYQFALAPLTLHALITGHSRVFMRWLDDLADPPAGCTFFNFTASHDGIGLRPAEGLLTDEEVDALVDHVRAMGGFVSMRSTAGGGERPYEVNVALFDVLAGTIEGGADAFQIERFLVSQILTLSLRGVPALYIHSLLATGNDLAGVERTGRTRSINRPHVDLADVEADLVDMSTARAQVFAALTRVLRVRQRESAFSPNTTQTVRVISDALVTFRRGEGAAAVFVIVNVSDMIRTLDAELRRDLGIEGVQAELLGETRLEAGQSLRIEPYAALWLKAAQD
ncbi:MAG: sugar phosphorylase [Pseudomonadota bacterium]|nr:sugar phosphorylase [Pseudomonadota bacterium]